jgi:hypothetical protein
MKRQTIRTRVLEPFGQINSKIGIILPPGPVFDEHGQGNRLSDFTDHSHGQIGISEQGRPAPVLTYPGHGTTHIHIHPEKPFVFDPLCRQGHIPGI